MWRERFLLCVVVWAAQTGMLTGRGNTAKPVVYGFANNEMRSAVERAVTGAAARLARPECEAVLADFTVESGRDLATTLAASGRTPAEAFGLLRFVDDRAAVQCGTRGTLAFTQPGSRLIRVCGRQFKEHFTRNAVAAEIIVIHEFLHALGLGENPPTSAAITEQVTLRCGD